MAREKLGSVRANRTFSRAGMWATGPRQLTLPVEAHGLSEVTVASGSLAITPDYDVLAWLCERWLRRPTDSGWMCPTLYELGSDLYDTTPSGEHYRTLRASVRRLALVGVEITGFNAMTGEPDPATTYGGPLMEANWPEYARGADRLRIRLAEWLRCEMDRGASVRLPWQTLRAFSHNEKLAKRLWVYLQAERYKPSARGLEASWMTIGDRLFAALGMDYVRPRAARAALARACQAILRRDARYRALEVVHFGRSWRITADRLTADELRRTKAERQEARSAIRTSLGL